MTQDNTGKIIAVGDIHGCDEALEVLLSVLLRWPGTCVFLGDYLDRGPSSVRVIELLHNARKQRPDWKFLMGNHEAMFLDILESGLDILTPDSAAEEYAQIGAVPRHHRQFLEDLLPWWESEAFLFVHGGIGKNPHLPVEEHDLEELLWTRRISPEWRGKTIVRGHDVVENPCQFENHINLDTGCCYGYALTAGILDEQTGRLSGYLQATYEGELKRFFRSGSEERAFGLVGKP